MDINKTAKFIQTLRKEQSLTQKQLAEKLGCTDKAVSRWETGAGLPDVAILLDLSKVLGVSVNEILMGEKLVIEKIPDTTEQPTVKNEVEIVTCQIITATDKAVVEVLKDSEVKLKKKNKTTAFFIGLCLIQLLAIFALPQMVSLISHTAEPIVFWLYPTVLLCFAAGFIRDKIKWLYPLFLSVSIFAPIPFSGNDGYVYFSIGLCAFGVSSVIILLCHAVMTAIRKIKNAVSY